METKTMLNKTIWLLWLQGWDRVPWLVKQVAESWEINNPDWTIEYVTLDNLHEYVDDIDYIYDETKTIEPAAKSDIIRLSLLKNHGGVWADATMLCMQPLSPWVGEAVEHSALWMYHGNGGGMDAKHGPASWFIISEKDSLPIGKWKKACDEYWGGRTSTDNYFWLDGLFRQLLESDVEFRNKWNLTPYLYCESKGQAHSLYRRVGEMHWLGLMSLNSPSLKKIFLEKPPYVLKSSWKEWQEKFPDVNGTAFQESNGYYAIQMSKRKFVFKHQMLAKNSIFFQGKMLALRLLFAFEMFRFAILRFPQRLLRLLERITRKARMIFST
jgi:Capsular polysaccharide synthesis protein